MTLSYHTALVALGCWTDAAAQDRLPDPWRDQVALALAPLLARVVFRGERERAGAMSEFTRWTDAHRDLVALPHPLALHAVLAAEFLGVLDREILALTEGHRRRREQLRPVSLDGMRRLRDLEALNSALVRVSGELDAHLGAVASAAMDAADAALGRVGL